MSVESGGRTEGATFPLLSVSELLATRPSGPPPLKDDEKKEKKHKKNKSKPLKAESSTNKYDGILPTIGKTPPSSADATLQIPLSSSSEKLRNEIITTRSLPSQSGPPPGWTKQQMTDENINKTKSEWDNTIARQILSLYASSQAFSGKGTAGRDMLRFVGDSRATTGEGKRTIHAPRSISRGGLEESGAWPNSPPRESQRVKSDTNTTMNAIDEESSKPKKSSTKKTKKSKSIQSSEKESTGESKPPIADLGLLRSLLDSENTFPLPTDNPPSSTTPSGSARATSGVPNGTQKTTNTTHTTVEIPPCYPVWFVGTDPAHKADWSILPGGSKVHAHLSLLYETQQFSAYLHILEVTVLRVFANLAYRSSDLFAIPQFGLSSRYDSTIPSRYSGAKKSNGGLLPPPRRTRGTRKLAAKQSTGKMVTLMGDETGEVAGGSGVDYWDQSMLDAAIAKEMAELDETNSGSIITGTSDYRFGEYGEEDATQLTMDDLELLWQQLVRVTLSIGCLCADKEDFRLSLYALGKAQSMVYHEDLVSNPFIRRVLFAETRDCLAFYFYKRGKLTAATAYCQDVYRVCEKSRNPLLIERRGMSLVHMSAAYIRQRKFKDAHKLLCEFFALLEDGDLGHNDASARLLCSASIAYHNQAVALISLSIPSLALKASQAALRLSRLCLAYSMPWTATLRTTHAYALREVQVWLAGYLNVDVDDVLPTEKKGRQRFSLRNKSSEVPSKLDGQSHEELQSDDFGVITQARTVLKLADTLFKVDISGA